MKRATGSSELLADVLKTGMEECCGQSFSPRQRQVIHRLLACGTGELGYHIYRCEQCHHVHSVAHSCRDRHCPRCQGAQAGRWLERQQEALLPVPYFHVVFTLPHQLNSVIRQNPKACLGLLFSAACSTVLDFGKNNLGAQLGVTAVLHTWGQTLSQHYHVHLIVTGGGLSVSGDEWIGVDNPRWLFSTRAMSKVYQARYLEGMKELFESKQLEFHGKIAHWSESDVFFRQIQTWSRRKWNVYAKAPFAGAGQVLKYLSLYTHRVAITAGRIKKLDKKAKTVSFSYRNYRKEGSPWQKMILSVVEFTRRFANHILPKGFCKIRHYGIVSTRNRKAKLALCRYYLNGDLNGAGGESLLAGENEGESEQASGAEEAESSSVKCPRCGCRGMKTVSIISGPMSGGGGIGSSTMPPPVRGRSPPKPRKKNPDQTSQSEK